MIDIKLGDTHDFKFTSRRFSTGAPFTLAGTPVVSAYPDNSTTELTAGITLTADFDTRTGLNNVRVVASGANGYAAGSNYALVITAGTVDGVSVVGEVIAQFSIERSAAHQRLGAPVGASISADVAGVQADTNDVQARIPAALTGGGNMKADALAWAGSATATDDLALKATLAKGSDLTGFNDLDAAGIRSAVGLASANLDTQLDALPTAAETATSVWASGTRTLTSLGASLVQEIWDRATSALTTVGSIGKLIVDNLNATVSSRASQTTLDTLDDFVDTEVAAIKAKTDNLPASPAAVGDIPTAAVIADQVWDEILSGHLGAGSTGNALNAAGAAGDPWSTALPGAYGAGSAGKILGDNLNATVSSRASQASLDSHETSRASMQTALVAEHDATQATLVTIVAYVDELETRLSAARAGYLDNLSGGAVGLEATLTAMKGAGWSTETLKAIKDALLTSAQVNTEMLDVLTVDTFTEPSGVPAATASLKDKIGWLAHLSRAKRLTTATSDAVRNDGDTATIATATVSDDGTTFTRGKYT
jgi:hypothetical protein